MDVANDESDDDREFTDDEDDFIMMTPAATLSQKIAMESATTQVSFTCSMLNMLDNRLCNVSKNCQFHSPFDSKGRCPDIPLTKALALMKKIKIDTLLHMYLPYFFNHTQHHIHVKKCYITSASPS
jgi:hypothetical protein